MRPRRNLPGCAPISPTPGPAKSAATPRSGTPPASWPRPHHFPGSLTPRGQPPDQGWPWLGPLVLGDFCVSASSSVRWDEVMKTPHPKELLRTEGKSPFAQCLAENQVAIIRVPESVLSRSPAPEFSAFPPESVSFFQTLVGRVCPSKLVHHPTLVSVLRLD